MKFDTEEAEKKAIEKIIEDEKKRLGDIAEKVGIYSKTLDIDSGEEFDYILSRFMYHSAKSNQAGLEDIINKNPDNVNEDKVIEVTEINRDTMKIADKRGNHFLRAIVFDKFCESEKGEENE